jgi:hypothetical protein
LEDRRPGSNADPYRIVKVILDSLEFAENLMNMKNYMTEGVNVEAEKYGAISNEELLSEYMTDDIRTTNDPFYSNGQQ